MGLTRIANWDNVLLTQIEQTKDDVFEYGKNDCTTWSTDILKTYTNLNWAPFWENKRDALKAQAEMPMEVRVTKELEIDPLPNINFTRRGDLVQKGLGMSATLGICLGSKVVFRAKPAGLQLHKLVDCTFSWRI
jgi:hypothetical protein